VFDKVEQSRRKRLLEWIHGPAAEPASGPVAAALPASPSTAGPGQPAWAALMARKRRKTLIICPPCHNSSTPTPSRTRHSHRRVQRIERCPLGSEGGCAEKAAPTPGTGPRRAAHPVT
jgi:hypothetical protein